MAPGQRADVLVQAGAPGTYALQSLPHDQGYPSPPGLFATVVVSGEPKPMPLPQTLPAPPLETIQDAESPIAGPSGSRRTCPKSSPRPNGPSSAS